MEATSLHEMVVNDYVPKSTAEEETPTSAPVPLLRRRQSQDDHLLGSPSEEESPRNAWIPSVFAGLLSWLTYNTPEINEEVEVTEEEQRDSGQEAIWRDWEWVLSSLELALEREKSSRSAGLRSELRALRARGETQKFRRWFETRAVRPAMRKIESDEGASLLSQPLEASKLSSIINKIIADNSDAWLSSCEEAIRGCFAAAVNGSSLADAVVALLNEEWAETTYARNITGSLREVAFVAAGGATQGAGLSKRIAAEVLWALWKSLVEAVRSRLPADTVTLTEKEFQTLADAVALSADALIGLYISTVRNSALGSARAGLLPQQFTADEAAETARVSDKVAFEGVDAKFDDVEGRRERIELELAKMRGDDAQLSSSREGSGPNPEPHADSQSLAALRSIVEAKLMASGILPNQS